MENLNFEKINGSYVSDLLDGGESGVVAFQLVFENPGAKVAIEICVDRAMGWNVADTKFVQGYMYCNVINGVLKGLNVRIRTSERPDKAKISIL